jgi:hypothetical protein
VEPKQSQDDKDEKDLNPDNLSNKDEIKHKTFYKRKDINCILKFCSNLNRYIDVFGVEG